VIRDPAEQALWFECYNLAVSFRISIFLEELFRSGKVLVPPFGNFVFVPFLIEAANISDQALTAYRSKHALPT
jgi:hypothetical protein